MIFIGILLFLIGFLFSGYLGVKLVDKLEKKYKQLEDTQMIVGTCFMIMYCAAWMQVAYWCN